MKISGFTFVRNGTKMDYPMKEAIASILPICDEFVIALGEGDTDDTTREVILSLNSDKIRIIDTVWDQLETLRSGIYSQQTNIALDNCTGDWCFYIQLDEVIHEKYLAGIVQQCSRFLHDTNVEGFLFNYKHFWGDYDHYFINHKWYPREVRILRNGIGARSIGDAQSFRMCDGRKLNVVHLPFDVYHYGYVKHPAQMQAKSLLASINYRGKEKTEELFAGKTALFDYGPMSLLAKFNETYPAVMKDRINQVDWKHLLRETGRSSVPFVHEKVKYTIITFIEQRMLRGKYYFGYRPYKILKSKVFRTSQPIDCCSAECDSSQPPVSIVIAVYNRPDTLQLIFESLVRQSMPNFEIVIADDGSGESIRECISDWKGRFFYPIRHVWHEDSGFRKTIIVNQAISAARGEYVICIDGDAIPHHLFIEDHVRRKEKGAVLAGRRVMIDEKRSKLVGYELVRSGKIENPFRWVFRTEYKTGQYGFRLPFLDPMRNQKRSDYFVLGSNFSLYKSDFLKLNGYDERIVGRGMEDNNLHARILSAKMPIRSISQVALQYHLFHRSDPIPHDDETVKQFCSVDSGWTPFGIVKE